MRSILAGLAVFVGASLLSGCAGSPIAAANNARTNYEKSVADYRSCLTSNSSNPNACEAKRQIMETDERAFNNLSADVNTKLGGGTRGSSQSIVVQQSR